MFALASLLFASVLSFSGCTERAERSAAEEGIYISASAETLHIMEGKVLRLEARGDDLAADTEFRWDLTPTPEEAIFDAGARVLIVKKLSGGSYRVTLSAKNGETVYEDAVEVSVGKESLVQLPSTVVVAPGSEYTLSAEFSREVDVAFSWRIDPPVGVQILEERADALRMRVDQAGEYHVSLQLRGEFGRTEVTRSTLFASYEPVPVFSLPAIVEPGEVVTLDARESGDPFGRALRYFWEISSPHGVLQHIKSTDATSEYHFTEGGTYHVSLHLDLIDGENDAPEARYHSRVVRVNGMPVAKTHPSGSMDLTVDTETVVDASTSSDEESDALLYRWFAQPADALWISNPSSPQSTIRLLQPREVRLFLEVYDGDWESGSVTELLIRPNRAPEARGPGNLVLRTGGSIRLDGSASFDLDGQRLFYSWIAEEHAGIRILNADTVTPDCIIEEEGVYRIRFSVSDGIAESSEEYFSVVSGPYWFIDSLAPDGGNGENWEQAFQEISQALEAAKPRDEIWIAEGVYYPAAPEFSFVLPPGVSLYGGFSRSETYKHQRKPADSMSVLSGDIDGNDLVSSEGLSIMPEGTNSVHVVEIVGDAGTDTVLDGVYITGGRAASEEDFGYVGGGMLVVDASPVLRNIVFETNTAKNFGGGLYVQGGGPQLTNVRFIHNSAELGGGYFDFEGTSKLSQGVFLRNFGVRGGALYIERSRMHIANTHVEGNAAHVGAGLVVTGSRVVLANVTVLWNKLRYVHNEGAGMIVTEESRVEVINSVFWNHEDEEQRDLSENVFVDSSRVSFEYSLVGASKGSGASWDMLAGYDMGGNIDTDPLFHSQMVMLLSPSRPDDRSPLRDSGSPVYVPRDVVDLDQDGNFYEAMPYDLHHRTRHIGDTIDMGAEEMQR